MAFCARSASVKTTALKMTHRLTCRGAATMPWYGLSAAAVAQDTGGQKADYEIKVLPPGGPTPRLADGHPDLTGHWFPNGAGQGVSGRFGVDPAALGAVDPK